MITVTGATGRTGRRVTEALRAKGETVRAVGRDSKKLAALAALGAEPFAGNVEDIHFLGAAFADAAAVYLVLPEDLSQEDLREHQERVSDCYAAALTQVGVPFVVNLSSIGAQHAAGTGPIVGLHNQEQKLSRIGKLNVLHLRAGYFMENLLMSLIPLRATGTLPGGMRGDVPMPWIATRDIGDYAANRLAARDFSGSSVQELHGQRDLSMKDAAAILGVAVGNPAVAYVQVPRPSLEAELLNMGLPKKTAELILEMWDGANSGLIVPKEERSPRNTTLTTLESFIRETFVPAYFDAA